MKFEVKSKENNEVKFEAVIGQEKFEQAVTEAYNKNKSKFNIPGFRKGKVPRKMIETQYGEGVFYEEAVNIILPEAYSKGLEELSLDPVDRPDVDIVEIGKGKDLVVAFDVTVMPEVELGEYKGLELEKADITVTDEDVMEELNSIREQNARLVNVEDRAVEEGDLITIDFVGKIDGEAFEGGSAEGHELEIGSGSFIPGFEEQLIGTNVDDTVEVEVTFPEDYQQEDLAGEDAVFEVKIIGNKVKELPELDDDFAIDTSEFDTLEEYKADIKEKMIESREASADRALRDQVIEKAVANMTVEIPEVMIEQEIDGMFRNLERQLSQQGLNMDQYLQFSGKEKEDMKAEMREDAKKRVETGLLFDAIKEAEEFDVTEEELNEEYSKYAEMQDKSIEEIKELLSAQEAQIKDSIISRKLVDFLIDNAEIK